MDISFQHVNPAGGHESTLLHAAPGDDHTNTYLIDAGEAVTPAGFLGPEEALDGVFLTHAHTDHYAGLSQVLSSDGDTPLYTSPATATLLELLYTEADRYRDLGDVAPITEALTPIDGWTPLEDGIYVLPVPAGHTPGAAGFLFRIDDPPRNETVTVLATGDFTPGPASGYPGLTIPESIDVDVMIANAATAADFEGELTGALETILERSLSGATTLVATGALTGVHVAYLLGNLLDEIDRRPPIHLVGQAAKVYTALEYDVPFVTAHPEFAHTDEVLGPGAVTIAGPEGPTQGSTARLFGVIRDDPDAVFVQLATSGLEAVDGATCGTHYVELSNHPTEQQFVETVEANLPRHLVLKHVHEQRAREIGGSFDNLFYWANDDTRAHRLYTAGDWPAPPWLDDSTASRIRRRNYRQSGSRIPIDRPIDDLPTPPLTRQAPALAAEGVDVSPFEERFESTPTDGPTTPADPASADGGRGSASAAADSGGDGVADRPLEADGELLADVTDRLDGIEARLEGLEGSVEDFHASFEDLEAGFDELTDTIPEESAVEMGLTTLEDRLDALEATIDDLPRRIEEAGVDPVPGTVLRQGDLVLFRVDADELTDHDLSLEHRQDVELTITEVQNDLSDGG